MVDASRELQAGVLTEDEYTVLAIAAGGNSMMAVARWEKPTESLAKKGFLERLDKFNHIITPTGRKVLEERERQDEATLDNALRNVIEKGSKLSSAQHKAAQEAELSVQHLVNAVSLSCSATGDSFAHACRQWSEQIVKAALERLK